MKKINQILAVAVAVGFLLSVLMYRSSVSRAERFERGQKFLANLNPSEIATIEIHKGDETVTLKKEGESYTVTEAHGYPAKNEAINRFVRDVLELDLQKEVGRGEDLQEELGLDPLGEDGIEVAFINRAAQDMVRFRVGDSFADGSGNYIQRFDGDEHDIYLTSKSVFLSTDRESFLKKEILDVSSSEIERISGEDFFLERGDDDQLTLADIPGGKREKTSETSGLKSILSRLSFQSVYLADDEEVKELAFEPALRVDLKDQSGYLLSLAAKEERAFLRVSGYHRVSQVEISPENTDEELKEKADVLSRAEEMETFNNLHGSWVYEISEATAEKLRKRRPDLLESSTT